MKIREKFELKFRQNFLNSKTNLSKQNFLNIVNFIHLQLFFVISYFDIGFKSVILKISLILKIFFLVLLCAYISLGLIFVPKVIHIYHSPDSTPDDGASVSISGGGSTDCGGRSSNVYKSDQLRFHQLVKENNELKRQIEIVSVILQDIRDTTSRIRGHKLSYCN